MQTSGTLTSLLRVLAAPFLFASLLSAGCANMGSGASRENSAIKQTHTQFIDGWNKRDVKIVSGALHTKGTFSSPNAGGPLNHQQFQAYLQTLFTAVPDFTVKNSEMSMIDKNSSAEQWVVAGTWTQPFTAGPLAGMPATGKSFVLSGSNFIEWRDGKMTSVVQYFDNLSLLTQLGVIGQK